jgi:dihydrofolate reductase
LKTGRIDHLWLSIIPTVLGKGVRLFPELPLELPLKLGWDGTLERDRGSGV